MSGKPGQASQWVVWPVGLCGQSGSAVFEVRGPDRTHVPVGDPSREKWNLSRTDRPLSCRTLQSRHAAFLRTPLQIL